MFDTLMGGVPQILGFGFLGLSVVMVALGYFALLKVTSHPEPSDSSIALARFFLILCVGCLILAGPLQIGLMAAERFLRTEVAVSFDMPTRKWQSYHGQVHLRHDGKPYVLQGGTKVPGTVRADGSVEIDVDDIIEGFEDHSDRLQAATELTTAMEGDLSRCRADLVAARAASNVPAGPDTASAPPVRPPAAPSAPTNREIVEDAG